MGGFSKYNISPVNVAINGFVEKVWDKVNELNYVWYGLLNQNII